MPLPGGKNTPKIAPFCQKMSKNVKKVDSAPKNGLILMHDGFLKTYQRLQKNGRPVKKVDSAPKIGLILMHDGSLEAYGQVV